MTDLAREAAEIHDVYLATAKRLGWLVRPEVDVPYGQLSDDAKALDIAFAEWHEQRLRAAIEAEREACAQIADNSPDLTVHQVANAIRQRSDSGEPHEEGVHGSG